MYNRQFNSRKPVFTCTSCGHITRLTSDVDDVCEHCYEIAGIDNYFNDNDRDHTSECAALYLAEANERLAAIRKRAGDAAAERVRDSSPYVWTHDVSVG